MTQNSTDISVYTNMHGDIVIRQPSLLGSDHTVVLPRDRLDALIVALQAQAGAEAEAHEV